MLCPVHQLQFSINLTQLVLVCNWDPAAKGPFVCRLTSECCTLIDGKFLISECVTYTFAASSEES